MTFSNICVIAEAGVNHNGDMEIAKRLVDEAVEAGADIVKFQTFSAEKLVAPNSPTAEYQAKHTGLRDQFTLLKGLELTDSATHALKEYADERGIEFLSTAFDLDSLRFLVSLGIRRIKSPSGELTNVPFLEGAAGFGLPLLISTGMAEMAEVHAALSTVRTVAPNLPVTLLHCTSNYPTPPSEANLLAMRQMAEETRLPVGYSDHTEGVAVAVAAAALGAVVIEKHFTLDRSMPGPDHKASLEPDQLKRMVREIRAVSAALGDGVKRPMASEMSTRAVARRSLVAASSLSAGSVLREEDVAILRPGTGLPPAALSSVIGARLARDVEAGAMFDHADFEDASVLGDARPQSEVGTPGAASA